MLDFGRWVDAHSHLTDPRLDSCRQEWLQDAQKKGVSFFLQGGIDPVDWQRQKQLQEQLQNSTPLSLGLCFGLHPYWVAAHEEEECEQALDQLVTELPHALAIGEMGLDFRPHLMKNSRLRQLDVFQQQIEIAEVTSKPMVLHLVQAHEEALRLFYLCGVPRRKGFVHSFNGSWAQAEQFISLGLYLSVGGPVARDRKQKLHEAIARMPLEYLLIETDSPDQPPDAYKGQLNPPASLWDVAKKIAEIRKMTPAEILDMTSSNFRRLFLL